MFLFLALHAHALPTAPKVVATYSVPQLAQRELCYPSGLRAHLVEQPASDLAAVASVVGAGTASEAKGQQSAAHMVEHLWFHARPGDGLRIWDQTAGLAITASTHHDVTTYTTVGSPNDLEGLLRIEAVRLTDPLVGVTEAELTLEQQVVKDELLYRGEHGLRMAVSHLDGMLFPEGHPYRHTIATGPDVDALTLDTLRAFADEQYVPRHTTLSVEAARSLDDQQALLEAAFGPLLAGSGVGCDHPRSDEPPPPPVAPGTMHHAEAPVRGKQVYLAWSLPASWGPDHTYETLAAPQLSRVIRSRLPFARGLKGDQSDASLGCHYQPGKIAARMLCRIDLPNQADAQHVVELVLGSLDAQWGISAQEQESRTRQLSNLVSSTFQQALAQSDDLSAYGVESRAHQRHVVGTTAPVVAELDQALAIDPEQLARTAATWLTAERAAILVVEPGGAVSTDARDLPQLKATLTSAGTPSWQPAAPGFDLKRTTLENGLQVVRSYRGAAPATRMALERPVGELLAPDGARFYWDSAAVYRMPGVSFTDLRTQAGVSSWEDLDLGASSLHAFASDGSSGLAAWSLRVWLDSLSMDPAYVQTSVDRALDTLEGDLATWPLLHTRSLRAEHLFPGHPWARPWWQDVALARKTRQGEVMKWRKAMDRADLATLLVVSPDDDAVSAADKFLGKWKGSKGEASPPPPVPRPRPRGG